MDGTPSSSSTGDGENPFRKGQWSMEEDDKLREYITKHGPRDWRNVPKRAGLNRPGKSCRLRWVNYLRPEIKRGNFSPEEDLIIINLHSQLGNRWSTIAKQLPGRTDNEIKNYWNMQLRKKLQRSGIDPETHMPLPRYSSEHVMAQLLTEVSNNWESAIEIAKLQLLQNLREDIFSQSGGAYATLGSNTNYQCAPTQLPPEYYPTEGNPSDDRNYYGKELSSQATIMNWAWPTYAASEGNSGLLLPPGEIPAAVASQSERDENVFISSIYLPPPADHL